MKKVYIAQHPAEAHLIKGLLASYGISAVVRGEALFAARGGLPLTAETLPSVWVTHEIDFLKAREIVADYDSGGHTDDSGGPSWRCAGCGEMIEPQFSVCWKCGAEQPRE